MAISRERKEALVETYGQLISDSTALIFTDYQGVNVPKTQQLRRHMGEVDATFMVVKNRLLKIALVESGCADAAEHRFAGPLGVVFTGEDIGSAVKSFRDFRRQEFPNRDVLEITGGIVSNQLLDSTAMQAMADLPTLPEMRAILLRTLLAPATQTVQLIDGVPSAVARLLAGPGRGLAQVLAAHADQS